MQRGFCAAIYRVKFYILYVIGCRINKARAQQIRIIQQADVELRRGGHGGADDGVQISLGLFQGRVHGGGVGAGVDGAVPGAYLGQDGAPGGRGEILLLLVVSKIVLGVRLVTCQLLGGILRVGLQGGDLGLGAVQGGVHAVHVFGGVDVRLAVGLYRGQLRALAGAVVGRSAAAVQHAYCRGFGAGQFGGDGVRDGVIRLQSAVSHGYGLGAVVTRLVAADRDAAVRQSHSDVGVQRGVGVRHCQHAAGEVESAITRVCRLGGQRGQRDEADLFLHHGDGERGGLFAVCNGYCLSAGGFGNIIAYGIVAAVN